MTREEAIGTVITAFEVWESEFDTGNDWSREHKARDMAIEALKQDPILDKIRAEIHANAEMHEDGDYYLRDEWIDEIFDKYKAESEDK